MWRCGSACCPTAWPIRSALARPIASYAPAPPTSGRAERRVRPTISPVMTASSTRTSTGRTYGRSCATRATSRSRFIRGSSRVLRRRATRPAPESPHAGVLVSRRVVCRGRDAQHRARRVQACLLAYQLRLWSQPVLANQAARIPRFCIAAPQGPADEMTGARAKTTTVWSDGASEVAVVPGPGRSATAWKSQTRRPQGQLDILDLKNIHYYMPPAAPIFLGVNATDLSGCSPTCLSA